MSLGLLDRLKRETRSVGFPVARSVAEKPEPTLAERQNTAVRNFLNHLVDMTFKDPISVDLLLKGEEDTYFDTIKYNLEKHIEQNPPPTNQEMIAFMTAVYLELTKKIKKEIKERNSKGQNLGFLPRLVQRRPQL